MWHFVLSHFSPETVSVYRPLLLFIPFFCDIPSSVFFFCQSFSSGHFLSLSLLPSPPSLPCLFLLFISFHPHTLVFWLLHFWNEDTLLLCLMIFMGADCRIMSQVVDCSNYERCHLDGICHFLSRISNKSKLIVSNAWVCNYRHFRWWLIWIWWWGKIWLVYDSNDLQASMWHRIRIEHIYSLFFSTETYEDFDSRVIEVSLFLSKTSNVAHTFEVRRHRVATWSL